MNKRIKKSIIHLFKLVVSAGLVLWLIEKVDWHRVMGELSGISFPLLALFILLQMIGMFISTRKWQIIARWRGLGFGLKEGLLVYLTGMFINNFLPSTLGGDMYRGIWLAGKTEAKAASIATIVFDRFIGLWVEALLALVFLTLAYLDHQSWSAPLATAFWFLVIFILVDGVITWAYRKPWFHNCLKTFPFVVRRLIGEVAGYMEKDIWAKASLYALLFSFVGIVLSNYVLFASLAGTSIHPLAFLSVVFIVAIVSVVPVSLGNIGVREWAYFALFPLAGISGETAIAVALLSRFFQMLISFAAIPQYLRSRKKSITNNRTEK